MERYPANRSVTLGMLFLGAIVFCYSDSVFASGAEICKLVLSALKGDKYLQTIPGPSNPPISTDVMLRERTNRLWGPGAEQFTKDAKVHEALRQYIEFRIARISTDIRSQVQSAAASVRILPPTNLLAEVMAALGREPPTNTQAHATENEIVVDEVYSRFPIIYGAVVSHELAHVVQLIDEKRARPKASQLQLSILGFLFNPFPRIGPQTRKRELGAFAEQWDYLQIFPQTAIDEEVKAISKAKNISESQRKSFIRTLEWRSLPQDQFVKHMLMQNKHAYPFSHGPELLIKFLAWSGSIWSLISFLK